jgi:hypothetical protein
LLEWAKLHQVAGMIAAPFKIYFGNFGNLLRQPRQRLSVRGMTNDFYHGLAPRDQHQAAEEGMPSAL